MTDQPKGFPEALRSIQAGKDVIAALPTVIAQLYATDKFGADPIVDRHFVPGNAEAYGWPPLSPKYLALKQGNLKETNELLHAKGLRGSRADKSQGTFTLASGKLAGTTAEMIYTGELRNTIRTEGRIIEAGPGSVRIVWDGVPDWAHWHIDGGSKPGRPPKRDFLQPNSRDLDDLARGAQKFADQSIGQGRTSFTP